MWRVFVLPQRFFSRRIFRASVDIWVRFCHVLLLLNHFGYSSVYLKFCLLLLAFQYCQCFVPPPFFFCAPRCGVWWISAKCWRIMAEGNFPRVEPSGPHHPRLNLPWSAFLVVPFIDGGLWLLHFLRVRKTLRSCTPMFTFPLLLVVLHSVSNISCFIIILLVANCFKLHGLRTKLSFTLYAMLFIFYFSWNFSTISYFASLIQSSFTKKISEGLNFWSTFTTWYCNSGWCWLGYMMIKSFL